MLAVAQRRLLEVVVVGLRDRQRLVEGALDLRLEPALDRLVDEVGGDEEDENRGGHRQRQECEHQLRLEARADDLLSPLEAQLDEVAEEQHEQEQEDNQVEVEEREDDDVRGHGQLGRDDAHVERRQAADQHQEPRDDQEVPLPPVLLAQERHR